MVYEDGRVVGTGVAVCESGWGGPRILLGLRSDGQGWALAGGKVDEGETSLQAAVRELQEEFGITPKGELKLLEVNPSTAIIHGKNCDVLSYVYLSEGGFDGELKPAPREIKDIRWVDLCSVEDELEDNIFKPTRESLRSIRAYYARAI